MTDASDAPNASHNSSQHREIAQPTSTPISAASPKPSTASERASDGATNPRRNRMNRPNVRPIIGPNPTAGLVEVFAQIDEYRRKERKRFAQQLAAIGRADSDGQQATTQGRPTAKDWAHRYNNGHLRKPMTESPREIASRMPHRRALGEKAVDPAAESELGRMRLRGEVSEPEATAGEVYARMWRGYVATLNAPRCRGRPRARFRVRRVSGAADAQVLHLRSAQADLRRGVAGAGLNRSWCCAGGACGGHSRPAMRVFGPADAKAGVNCPG